MNKKIVYLLLTLITAVSLVARGGGNSFDPTSVNDDPVDNGIPNTGTNAEIETETLNLQGPATLPISFDGTLGTVKHQFSDSFTVVIPKEWVKPGLQIRGIARNNSVSHDIN